MVGASCQIDAQEKRGRVLQNGPDCRPEKVWNGEGSVGQSPLTKKYLDFARVAIGFAQSI
jgi:hypothetical protein